MMSEVQVEIIEFSDELAKNFEEITKGWTSEGILCMSKADKDVMQHPRKLIIDEGGIILFAKTQEHGIVGTCALVKGEDNSLELSKLGVKKEARGLKIGEKLLDAVVIKARSMDPRCLFLLTNKKCEAAIHLYEKSGWVYDQAVQENNMERFSRCNIAMSYPL